MDLFSCYVARRWDMSTVARRYFGVKRRALRGISQLLLSLTYAQLAICELWQESMKQPGTLSSVCRRFVEWFSNPPGVGST